MGGIGAVIIIGVALDLLLSFPPSSKMRPRRPRVTLSSPSSSSFTTGPPSLPTSNVFFAMSLFFVHGNEADGVSVSSAIVLASFAFSIGASRFLLLFLFRRFVRFFFFPDAKRVPSRRV